MARTTLPTCSSSQENRWSCRSHTLTAICTSAQCSVAGVTASTEAGSLRPSPISRRLICTKSYAPSKGRATSQVAFSDSSLSRTITPSKSGQSRTDNQSLLGHTNTKHTLYRRYVFFRCESGKQCTELHNPRQFVIHFSAIFSYSEKIYKTLNTHF